MTSKNFQQPPHQMVAYWVKNSTVSELFFSGRSTYVLNQAIKRCRFLTFKVNFLCQKLSESFSIFFIEEYKYRVMFFVIIIFWKLWFQTTLFSKIMPIFWLLHLEYADLPNEIVLFTTQLSSHLMRRLLKNS